MATFSTVSLHNKKKSEHIFTTNSSNHHSSISSGNSHSVADSSFSKSKNHQKLAGLEGVPTAPAAFLKRKNFAFGNQQRAFHRSRNSQNANNSVSISSKKLTGQQQPGCGNALESENPSSSNLETSGQIITPFSACFKNNSSRLKNSKFASFHNTSDVAVLEDTRLNNSADLNHAQEQSDASDSPALDVMSCFIPKKRVPAINSNGIRVSLPPPSPSSKPFIGSNSAKYQKSAPLSPAPDNCCSDQEDLKLKNKSLDSFRDAKSSRRIAHPNRIQSDSSRHNAQLSDSKFGSLSPPLSASPSPSRSPATTDYRSRYYDLQPHESSELSKCDRDLSATPPPADVENQTSNSDLLDQNLAAGAPKPNKTDLKENDTILQSESINTESSTDVKNVVNDGSQSSNDTHSKSSSTSKAIIVDSSTIRQKEPFQMHENLGDNGANMGFDFAMNDVYPHDEIPFGAGLIPNGIVPQFGYGMPPMHPQHSDLESQHPWHPHMSVGIPSCVPSPSHGMPIPPPFGHFMGPGGMDPLHPHPIPMDPNDEGPYFYPPNGYDMFEGYYYDPYEMYGYPPHMMMNGGVDGPDFENPKTVRIEEIGDNVGGSADALPLDKLSLEKSLEGKEKGINDNGCQGSDVLLPPPYPPSNMSSSGYSNIPVPYMSMSPVHNEPSVGNGLAIHPMGMPVPHPMMNIPPHIAMHNHHHSQSFGMPPQDSNEYGPTVYYN